MEHLNKLDIESKKLCQSWTVSLFLKYLLQPWFHFVQGFFTFI